jgi:hypothetical protein
MERRQSDSSLIINKMIVAFLGTIGILMLAAIVFIQHRGGDVPGELLIALGALIGNLGGALNTNRPTTAQPHPQVQNETVEKQFVSSSEPTAPVIAEEKEKPSE